MRTKIRVNEGGKHSAKTAKRRKIRLCACNEVSMGTRSNPITSLCGRLPALGSCGMGRKPFYVAPTTLAYVSPAQYRLFKLLKGVVAAIGLSVPLFRSYQVLYPPFDARSRLREPERLSIIHQIMFRMGIPKSLASSVVVVSSDRNLLQGGLQRFVVHLLAYFSARLSHQYMMCYRIE